MEKQQKSLESFTWEKFKSLQNNPDIFKNYYNYFFALSNWIKQNPDVVDYDMLSIYRLNKLLNIDVKLYLTEQPEISLISEPKRMFSRKPETVESLVMRIGDTLWDLVKRRSGKDCPNCKDDELNYVIAESIATEEKEIILECDSCGWTEKKDGSKWVGGLANIFPINKEEAKLESIVFK